MKGFLLGLSLALVLGSAWGKEEPGAVERVVGLLQGLETRIEKDGAYEQAEYDKLACWCETKTKTTAATIVSLRDLLKNTGNTILRLKGSVTTLAAQIADLVADIKQNQEQQAQLTSIRSKENAAFMAETAETQQALGALQKAITVLAGATTEKSASAFVQTERWTSTVAEVVSSMSKASMSVKLNKKQLALLQTLSSKYAPQSATIQGILGDMYTTFSKNVQVATSDEANSQYKFEDLIATLQKALNTLEETVVKKEQKKAENEIQLADATQLFADSEEQLKAEETLFDATKTSCQQQTAAWQTRSGLRTEELAGIAKALGILTDPAAKKLFASSIKPGVSKAASFIQMASISGTGTQNALKVLEMHARQSHSFRLAALAANVRMHSSGHFDEVLKTIDGLLQELDDEEQTDIKKVDSCKSDYQTLTSNKKDLDWKIQNNKAKVQKHQKAVDDKTATKKVVIADIATAVKTLSDMKTARTKENGEYVEAKKEDEKAIGLLLKAKEALAEYYASSFLQQAGDPHQKKIKLSGKDSAKGQTDTVVALLDNIIEDLNSELAETKTNEAASQEDYEALKKSVEDQKAALEKSKTNLDGGIAAQNSAKADEEKLQGDNEGSLKTEKDTEADLKKTCDDAIKNQPERREKRKVEADGLTQAREFLAGMSSDALIQMPKQEQKIFPTFQTLSFLQRH